MGRYKIRKTVLAAGLAVICMFSNVCGAETAGPPRPAAINSDAVSHAWADSNADIDSNPGTNGDTCGRHFGSGITGNADQAGSSRHC